jgi:hypothetical protein
MDPLIEPGIVIQSIPILGGIPVPAGNTASAGIQVPAGVPALAGIQVPAGVPASAGVPALAGITASVGRAVSGDQKNAYRGLEFLYSSVRTSPHSEFLGYLLYPLHNRNSLFPACGSELSGPWCRIAIGEPGSSFLVPGPYRGFCPG